MKNTNKDNNLNSMHETVMQLYASIYLSLYTSPTFLWVYLVLSLIKRKLDKLSKMGHQITWTN